MLLIYLDNCSFNRPFDDQNQIRIRIETEAKLFIQENIVSGRFQMVWSYILDFENDANPFSERKETIGNWKKYAVADINASEEIILLAKEIQTYGVKSKDALHVACAIALQCNYFITTDLPLIKKLCIFENIKVVNPVDFINYIDKK